MRRVRLVTTLGAGLLMALALAACGGDSSPEVPIVLPTETTTASAGSKTDFIDEADATCQEVNTQIQQFASAGQGLTEADQIADLRQSVIDDLNALGPPDEDRATLDEYLAALEQQVEAGKKIALATARGEDTAQFEEELATARDAGETAAAAYGFQECGQPISSTSTSTDTGAVSPEPSAPVAPAPSDTGGSTDSGTGDTGGGTGGTGGAGGIGPG